MRYGTGHLGYTVPTCAAESLPHSGQCPLGVVYVSGSEKDTQAGLFMSLRQAGVGASLSRNLQNQNCVARLAPGRPESGNGGVCGWCTTTHSGQCPLGVVYVSGFVKKQLKSG